MFEALDRTQRGWRLTVLLVVAVAPSLQVDMPHSPANESLHWHGAQVHGTRAAIIAVGAR